MKNFQEVLFDLPKCRAELNEFGELLRSKDSLSEQADILPFFKARQQLSALIGSYAVDAFPANRLAFE